MMYSVAEAAECLAITKDTMYKMIHSGIIPAKVIRSTKLTTVATKSRPTMYRITESDLLKFIEDSEYRPDA